MKRMDEMDRNIHLRAQEIAYKVTMLVLSVWTFFNCWQTLANGAAYEPWPGLIFCSAASIQGFAQIAIKQKMVAGDEEYRAPNQLLRTIITTVAVTIAVLTVGMYLVMKL